MTRKELRDRQDKYDAHVTKIGQASAKRYLDAKVQGHRQSTGLIREIIAGTSFVIMMATVTVIILSL
jgi:hypothetical protein